MTRKPINTCLLQDISIGVDKQSLRLQFSRNLSKEIWGLKSQKYLYLKLSDTEENREIAQKIAIEIQLDIRANKLQKDIQSYLPTAQLKKEVGIFYNPNEIRISLLELYYQYCEYKKPTLAESTYREQYQVRYFNKLKKCPQNLNKQHEIIDFLYQNTCAGEFKKISSLLHTMTIWAKKRELIPPQAPNLFKELRNEYPLIKPKKQPPKYLQNIEGYHQDPNYIAFSQEDAETIMQAFRDYAEAEYQENGLKVRSNWKIRRWSLYRYVCFLFWTGCRTGEASAMKWKNVAADCSYVVFRQTYNHRLKKNKALKTEMVGEEGTQSRKFPCGSKLQAMLLEMKQELDIIDPNDFIFLNSRGTPVTNHTIEFSWYGNQKDDEMVSEGIVYKLAREKKIYQYLTPYATRHTWITHQLLNGVPITNIAKFAGNSPETILKHYAGYLPNISLAPEI